jgi:hypothetical protein
MLTGQQVERFIEITSDHVGFDAEDVIATRDTLDNFVEAQGKPSEVEEHFCGDDDYGWNCSNRCWVKGAKETQPEDFLYIWHLKHQRRLYVVDFGDVRAACLLD